MFRKTIIAIAATAAVAVATLPSSASAHKFGPRWGFYGAAIGFGLAATALYANTCRTVIETRYNARRDYYYQVPVTYC